MTRHFAVPIVLCLLAWSASANPMWISQSFVPVNPGTVAGANESVWTTTLYAYNNGDLPANIECDQEPCPVIAPHSSAEIAVPWSSLTHQGFWLRAYSISSGFTVATTLTLELRTVDSSNQANAGTEIPLIATADFQNGGFVLPNVPVNGHSRILLRVYTVTPTTAHVRVSGVSTGTVIQQGDVQTSDFGSDAPSASYAEVPIDSTGSEAMRVDVTATDLTWGFVSVTDNVTNQFTIVAPHTPEVFTLSPAKK